MKLKIISLFVFIIVLSSVTKAVAQLEVKLEKKTLPSIGRLEGISNIFFQPLKDSRFQYPHDWQNIEIAAVLENKAFLPIYAARYKDPAGQFKYFVDTNGDQDFRNETPLHFQQQADLQIADTVLAIQSIDQKEAARNISYQILTSSDGYIYARISEYRQGEIRLGGNTYSVFIRPRFRDVPLYGLSTNIVCRIDMDRDGNFSSAWRLSADGKISPTEEIDLTSPFMLEGQRLKVSQLDSAGTRLVIEPTDEQTSIAVGFKAPDFTVAGVDEKMRNLKQLRGKIIFLEFWSVSCPFCKQILPQVNSLVESKAGKDFVALAIAREDKREEIQAYLKQYPLNADVMLNEKSTWQTYDSQTITPTFYLIDKEGVVRFSGYGAAPEQIKIIDKLIEKLRNE